MSTLWDSFYAVIRRIPRGRVATYGAVAGWAGKPRFARHVGFALAGLTERRGAKGVPWQRVVGGRGKGYGAITIKDPIGAGIQRQLLEAEGVKFDASEKIPLVDFGWRGPGQGR